MTTTASKRASPRASKTRTRKASERTPGAAKGRGERSERSSARQAALQDYWNKRRFDRTPEPRGKARSASTAGERPFVVQKHAARNLHYDFRLELNGVLLSWSVPKGPSLRPGDRRLAVRTEDHPLEYADFEGIIPPEQYGAGTVIVWDRGTWEPEADPQAGVEKGRLTFTLKGEKLRGRFHLVRTRLGGKRENWLLFKGHDQGAPGVEARGSAGEKNGEAEIVQARPESALSGRTLEQVAEQPARVWQSNRAVEGAKRPARSPRKTQAKTPPSARAAQAGRDVLSLVQALDVGIPWTNLEKVLFPEQNLRKAELIAYYAAASERMLEHLRGRPLTLVRCPEGTRTKCFYQKHVKAGIPDAVQELPIAEDDGKVAKYMMVRDQRGLLALGQLGVLELHTWTCHADQLERPDQFVFDLDPDPELAFAVVCDAARELRQRLSDLGLQSFVKTTGGKGLHVVLPVRRKLDWDAHKRFALSIAEAMERDDPRRYVTNMRKSARRGRIFVDYLRNTRGATAIAPYSPRARSGAPVATPLSWDELDQIEPGSLHVGSVLARLDGPDPWQDYHALKQSVSAASVRTRKT